VVTKDGPARTNGVRASGIRRIARLRLANGMAIECTPDHPVFTSRGWVNVEDLDLAEDFVGIVRELPCGDQPVPSHRPALLGYALSEHSVAYRGHFGFSSSSAAEIEDMRAIVECFDNTAARLES